MPLNNETVRGRKRYDVDLIQCDILRFEMLGGESKLIIVPKPLANIGDPRVLKIVANKIDLKGAWDATSQKGVAEITYDLDGDPPHKLDPEDPARQGDKGADGMDGDPNFGPLAPAGSYPCAQDGGPGEHGGRGGKGVKGQNGPILEIWVDEVIGKELTIDLRGQQGGKGGKGGDGGCGGNGENGSDAVLSDEWIGKGCGTPPGRGGDGGDGGNAGWGGDGGDGGNGGVVKIFATISGGADFSTWHFEEVVPGVIPGGKGGDPGDSGCSRKGEPGCPGDRSDPSCPKLDPLKPCPGKGGKAGNPGKKLVCPAAENAQDGRDGLTASDMLKRQDGRGGPVPGTPGKGGYYIIRHITTLPKFP